MGSRPRMHGRVLMPVDMLFYKVMSEHVLMRLGLKRVIALGPRVAQPAATCCAKM